ncbi:MAG: methyltransferase domain-containing protein [Flavobacteriales bacterium]|nr:methyltransferase domain-containing protein [Flavobacteriales bacterium]
MGIFVRIVSKGLEHIVSQLKQHGPAIAEMVALGRFVRGIDVQGIDLPPLPDEEIAPGSYHRRILTLEPLEVVLVSWPPGVASAVHHHEGFAGHVLVLEGQLENIAYTIKDGVMTDRMHMRADPGGVVPEPDGIIHVLRNPDRKDWARTLHFYFPALTDLDGMRIFDLANGTIATLNSSAKAASFSEPESSFSKLEKEAFRFVPFEQMPQARSHRIRPVVPKPTNERIIDMVRGYYEEQAERYDDSDARDPVRTKYTKGVNALIAEALRQIEPLDAMLALACGTGRRASNIRQLSGRDYELWGVDVSGAMADIASERGIHAINARWADADVPRGHFDACTILYAFGHVPGVAMREAWLRKVHDALRPGGRLYLDTFNLNDGHEWGPRARQAYRDLDLAEQGYDLGDVFYIRSGGTHPAFLHYFDEPGLRDLLDRCGFSVERIRHVGYVHRAGEVLPAGEQGMLYVEAIRR